MAKVSTKGYKKNSKDKNEASLRIPSPMITMKEDDGTPLKKGPILGIDDLGNQQMMYPGMDYQFPGNYVDEIPMAKMGGTKKVRIHSLPKAQRGLGVINDRLKRNVIYNDLDEYNKAHQAEGDSLLAATNTYLLLDHINQVQNSHRFFDNMLHESIRRNDPASHLYYNSLKNKEIKPRTSRLATIVPTAINNISGVVPVHYYDFPETHAVYQELPKPVMKDIKPFTLPQVDLKSQLQNIERPKSNKQRVVINTPQGDKVRVQDLKTKKFIDWEETDGAPVDIENPTGIQYHDFRYKSGGGLPKAQNGKNVLYVDSKKDPAYKAYSDSLNLYKAMIRQDKLMGTNTTNDPFINARRAGNNKPPLSDFTVKSLKEGRVPRLVPGLEHLGPIARDFNNAAELKDFANFLGSKNDIKLLDYYKSLGFNDNNIMYHTSADVVHPKIKPVDSYWDGSAWSPVYKKPRREVIVQKVPDEVPVINTPTQLVSQPEDIKIPFKADITRRQFPINMTGDEALDRLNQQLYGNFGTLTEDGYIPTDDPKYYPYRGIGPGTPEMRRSYGKFEQGGELPKAQKGLPVGTTKRKKDPIFTSDPNNIRLKQYSDSLDIYNLSNQVERIYPNLPQISKDKYDELEEKEDNLTRWDIDEVKYKEDKKNKKKNINLEDYVYSTKRKDIYDPRTVANMAEFESKYNSDPAAIEKFIITLPNGDMKIPNHLWEGKPDWEDYTIQDAKTGTSRWYGKDNNGKTKLFGVYPLDIEPIETRYYGKDTPVKIGSIQFNSKEFRNNKLTKAQEKQWQNYIYETEDRRFYEKPTQPVIYKKGYTGSEPPVATLQPPAKSEPTVIPYKGDNTRREFPIKSTGDAAIDKMNLMLFGANGALTDNRYIPLDDPKYHPYNGIGPVEPRTPEKEMRRIKTPKFTNGGDISVPDLRRVKIHSLPKAQTGIPADYQKFLQYSETAPDNRRPDAGWQYGNPRQYDHYGMWDALGKPENFDQALEINPQWQPDPYDGMYHGFSTNPSTGVWLKSHIPGESHPGDTGWMEYKDFMLSNDRNWGGKNQNLVYDPELQRMRYIERKKEGGSLPKAQYGPPDWRNMLDYKNAAPPAKQNLVGDVRKVARPTAVAESTNRNVTHQIPTNTKELKAEKDAQAAYDALPEAMKRRDTLSANNTSSTQKAINQAYYTLSNPLEAAGHAMKYGYLPQGNVGNYGLRQDGDAFSDVTQFANPMFYANAAYRLGEDASQKNSWTTKEGLINMGADALEAMPFFGAAAKTMAPGVRAFASHPLVNGLHDVAAKPKVYGPDYAKALTFKGLNSITSPLGIPLYKLPGINKMYKDAAFKVASMHSGASRQPSKVIKALMPGAEPGTYTGHLTSHQAPEENLVRQYIYGDGNMTKSNVPQVGLDKYTDMYGPLDNFVLKTNTDSPITFSDLRDATLTDVNDLSHVAGLPYKRTGWKGLNPKLAHLDDIERFDLKAQREALRKVIEDEGQIFTSHMFPVSGMTDVNIAGNNMILRYDPITGKFTAQTQDLWKFTPVDYSKKWSRGAGGLKEYSVFQQARLMDKAGKPFSLQDIREFDPQTGPLPKNKKGGDVSVPSLKRVKINALPNNWKSH